MDPFTIAKAKTIAEAVAQSRAGTNTAYIAGGTNLVDLMKVHVAKPARLIDIQLPDLKKIELLANGHVMIGALVTNSDLAYHPIIKKQYPLLSQAILSGASPQLRNMATTGGNILQRTRCYYFMDTASPCNKRAPGSGCPAIHGYNRIHAVLGGSDHCIATHPSDMCVALAALDAVVHTTGTDGTSRTIPFAAFHLQPGDTPHIEHALQPGELITAVAIPALPFAVHSTYLKIRDRASYEFALTSAAVALDLQDGIIQEARIALGGVGTIPWRAREAEALLAGKRAGLSAYRAAADAALAGARTHQHNAFKPQLAKQTIISALQTIGGAHEQ